MARRRSKVLDYFSLHVLRGVGGVLLLLPQSWSLAAVRGLARVAYHVDRRHRRVTIENLRIAFPERQSTVDLQRLALEVYRHLGQMLLETLLLRRTYASRVWRQEQVAAMAPGFRRAIDSGRPLVLVTGHIGNWELSAFIIRAYGIRAHLVARPIDNPYVDFELRRLRESYGHTVLSKHGDVRRMLAVLKQGGALCTLADQDAGRNGLFVDFFGRPASTHKAAAALAERTDALIVVFGAPNVGGLSKYAMRVPDVIDPRDYAHSRNATTEMMQRITTGIERLVRIDPTQYFWLHRRWKHAPPPPAAEAQAA